MARIRNGCGCLCLGAGGDFCDVGLLWSENNVHCSFFFSIAFFGAQTNLFTDAAILYVQNINQCMFFGRSRSFSRWGFASWSTRSRGWAKNVLARGMTESELNKWVLVWCWLTPMPCLSCNYCGLVVLELRNIGLLFINTFKLFVAV